MWRPTCSAYKAYGKDHRRAARAGQRAVRTRVKLGDKQESDCLEAGAQSPEAREEAFTF
jgi:hypothetical protein